MTTFVVTYSVEASPQRAACGGLPAGAGEFNVLVKAKDMKTALRQCLPAGDCYRMTIAPVHRDHTRESKA